MNASKKAGITDMLLLARNFGSGPRAALDINKDGKSNSTDMLIVVRNFNSISC